MEKVFFEIFSQPLFNLFYENFLNGHIWTNDQYSRPISIKNGLLADGGNPKYTLRQSLGWSFIWVLPQGHVKIIARSNQPKRVVFTSIVLI